jgi:ribosomal protein S18 acetylase RimI-like enzyme
MHIKRINSTERHLAVDLFDQYRVFYNQPSDKILADNFLKARLENNESVVFVALESSNGEDLPVGFTQLYPTYSSVRAVKNWILNDLYVAADHRKKGIGEQLIQAAMQFAKADGAQYVQLETAIDNYNAQRLYETIGFVKQQPETDYYVYRIAL